MSTVEDLISIMYGHYNQLIMSLPHIIQKCPVEMISKDRWKYFEINKQNMTLRELKV